MDFYLSSSRLPMSLIQNFWKPHLKLSSLSVPNRRPSNHNTRVSTKSMIIQRGTRLWQNTMTCHTSTQWVTSRPRNRSEKYPARPWVVERTLAWLKCQALLVRYAKHPENYLGLRQFACTLIWYRRLIYKTDSTHFEIVS